MAYHQRSKKGKLATSHSSSTGHVTQDWYPEASEPGNFGLVEDFSRLQVADTTQDTGAPYTSDDYGNDSYQPEYHNYSTSGYQGGEHQSSDGALYSTDHATGSFPNDGTYQSHAGTSDSYPNAGEDVIDEAQDPYSWTVASDGIKQRIQRECKSPYDGPGRPDFVPVPGTSVEYYDPHQPAQNQGFNENVYEARDAEITEKIRLERETYKSIQPQPLNNQKRYKGFRVCMIRWDMEKTGAAKKAGEVQGDMRVTPEMDKLEKAFGLWGYTVKRLVIPLEDSAAKLEKRLGRFLDKYGEDDLAIVLYIGHGGREKTGSLRFSWKSDDNTMRKIVAWEPMRKQLAAAKQDVLVILDCCFASSAWSAIKKDELGSPEHKRMAIMAACAADTVTWSSRWSISWSLAEVLTNLAGWDQTHGVSSLVYELQDVAKEHAYKQIKTEPEGYATNKHIATPYWFDVYSGYKNGEGYDEEIHLYPLKL